MDCREGKLVDKERRTDRPASAGSRRPALFECAATSHKRAARNLRAPDVCHKAFEASLCGAWMTCGVAISALKIEGAVADWRRSVPASGAPIDRAARLTRRCTDPAVPGRVRRSVAWRMRMTTTRRPTHRNHWPSTRPCATASSRPSCSMNLDREAARAELLEAMGVDVIEAGFPIASNGDFEAVSEVAKWSRTVHRVRPGAGLAEGHRPRLPRRCAGGARRASTPSCRPARCT